MSSNLFLDAGNCEYDVVEYLDYVFFLYRVLDFVLQAVQVLGNQFDLFKVWD